MSAYENDIIPTNGHQRKIRWMYAYERVLSRTIVYVKRTDSLLSLKKKWRFKKTDPHCSVALHIFVDLVKISTVLKGDRSI